MLFKFRNEEGSITIEAALIIPLLLTFFLFLMSLVKISIAEMALKESVSETAQIISHYTFLSMVAEKKIQETTDGFVDGIVDKAGGEMGNNEIAKILLEKIGGIGKGLIPTSGELISDHFAKDVYRTAVIEKYKQKVNNTSFFNPDGIKIIDYSYPTSRTGADVKVEAENVLKLVLPFFEKDIKIKKVAIERAWVGG